MKKVLVALSILAVASLAQAELLASWTTATAQNINSATIAQTAGGAYGFSMIGAGGFSGSSTPSVGTFGVAGATTASAALAYANNEYLYFTWNSAYTLTLESALGQYTRGNNGATSAQWGTIIGGTWTDIGAVITGASIPTATPTTSTVPTTTTFTGVSGLTSGQLGLAIYGGAGTTATDWFRLDSRPSATPDVALQLDGTMTAVPEPATMSLLGLGALAMVLRRKIRK